jgi:hypothetical protein
MAKFTEPHCRLEPSLTAEQREMQRDMLALYIERMEAKPGTSSSHIENCRSLLKELEQKLADRPAGITLH